MTDHTQASVSDAEKKDALPLPEEKVAITHHKMMLQGRQLAYTATAGLMHIRNEDEKKSAALFYTAYVMDTDGESSQRPLTFCFNGGPGSSSVWLHLGAFGPHRINMVDGIAPPPNAAKLVENECSLLHLTDLVFMDPVGTGFSRAGEDGKAEDFFGMEGDSDAMCRFIETYLNQQHRWGSPKFLAGESYGTTRAAAMACQLGERGIALNGLILVSLAVNFQTFIFNLGNDLPYLTFLPTYAAVAWRHGVLGDDVPEDLDTLLQEVRSWSQEVYAPALLRGSSIDPETKAKVAAQLAAYTGMDPREIEHLDLRIADMRFAKSVLKTPGMTVGRMDGRYVGIDVEKDHRRTQRDPSMDAPMGPYTGLINDHIRRTLAFDHESKYVVFNMKANEQWKWARKGKLGYPNTSDDLRRAMIQNPHLKVLFANGLFDLATPFFGAEHTADHLGLDPDLRANIYLTYYQAGHMMYFNRAAHSALRDDIADLFAQAVTTNTI